MMRTEQNNEIIKNKKSEVRSVMGRIIANKVKGMNWMAKVSLILVFTVMFSTFMLAGLLMPKEAGAVATAYHTFGTTTQSVGFDGSTNIVSQTGPINYVNPAGGPHAEFRAITTSTAAGSGINRIYYTGAQNINNDERFRAYTPAYTYDMKIAASATARIAVYNATAGGTSGSVWAEIYEYNDTIGLIGAAKGTTNVQTVTNATTGQYYTLTFTNPEFKVGAGNRIAVVYYASSVGINTAYLYGVLAETSATPTGSTFFTVDESRYFFVTTCGDCHGNPNQDGRGWVTQRNIPPGKFPGSHLVHSTDCTKCHNPMPGATNHRNGRVEFTTMFGGRAGGTYSRVNAANWFTQVNTVSPGTCTNTCHGAVSPTWGTVAAAGYDCVSCHNAARPKTLGGLGTIRQVTGAGGDYSRASRHLFTSGASTILKWDCIICHREGFAGWYTPNSLYYRVGRTDAAYHNEGTGATGGMINLRNVDDPTTGWAINNRAWTTTDYTNLDTFCLTCHDSDGANGISVNAANNGLDLTAGGARRLTPFNSANYPAGAVGASTSFASAGRIAITNIKDKFYPGTVGPGAAYNGNPSQHAVIGRRYSTIAANAGWGSWTAAAWTSTMLKKTGLNVNVTRETSLLTCADCHVIDGGGTGTGNAHGGTVPYNLKWATVSVFCNSCHNAAVYVFGASAAGSYTAAL